MPTLLRLAAALLVCAGLAPVRPADAATLRLSWTSCDPQRPDTLFTAPAWYRLVLSAADMTPGYAADSNLGTEIVLRIGAEDGGDVPDAWRFDAAGCQTGNQLVTMDKAFHRSCPTMGGVNPLPIVGYSYVPASRTCRLVLAIVYDAFAPAAGARYTLWQLWLNMEYAAPGPGIPGEVCGGAERQVRIGVEKASLLTQRQVLVAFQVAPGDRDHVLWGEAPPVATVPVTWGRVKGLYR